MQSDLDILKTKRKETPHHITTDELPEEARFLQLSTRSKQLIDTVKMIAYRAETAMANSLREHLKRPGYPTGAQRANTLNDPTRHAGCSPPCTPPKRICCPTPMRGP